jgi:hypothetical protein
MAEKISAAQAIQVYSEVPGVLRALASERDELKEKVAHLEGRLADYQKAERIEKIAQLMEERQIDVGTSVEEKRDRIKEAAAQGKSLDVIEEAVLMTAPRGDLAKLAEEVPGNGAAGLEAYLLGGLAD